MLLVWVLTVAYADQYLYIAVFKVLSDQSVTQQLKLCILQTGIGIRNGNTARV